MTENTKYISYLIEQAKKGSKSFTFKLLEINMGNLFPIAIRLTANEEIANKVLSQTVRFLMDNIGQVRMDSSFSSWLKAITVRECINTHFHSNPENRPGEGEVFIFNKNLLTDFDFGILRLPKEPRYVIVLYDLLRYSMTEVSDMLSIGSPENVRVMIKLARRKLIEDLRV